MEITLGRHLVVETRTPGVRVVRFKCPDLRPQLDNYGEIDDCELFQEIQRYALADLAAGEGLVLNLGRIEILTSAFLSFFLRVRAIVQNRQGWLVLCHLRQEHWEIFEVTQTLRLFTITGNEERAVCQAKGPGRQSASVPEGSPLPRSGGEGRAEQTLNGGRFPNLPQASLLPKPDR